MSASEGSLPARLFSTTLQRLVDTLELQEQLADNGGPFLPLVSQLPMVQGEVGNVRLFTGNPLFRVVTCSLTVDPIQLDSHMLFAFTPGDSAVPHFTLDSVSMLRFTLISFPAWTWAPTSPTWMRRLLRLPRPMKLAALSRV